MTNIFIIVSALAGGLLLGYFIRQTLAQRQANSIEAKLKERIEKVKEEAKQIILEAKEKADKIIEDARIDEKNRKSQVDKLEARLLEREELLDKRQLELDAKEKENKEIYEKIQQVKSELEKLQQSELATLEKIAKMSTNEAKEELFKRLEKSYQEELIETMRQLETNRKENIEKRAKEIMVDAIERYAHTNVSELTTTTLELPSDEIKGKIIGREGRNIRHFEKLTGVELILDDTPNTVILSSFNPVRRAVASLALEKLIKDGRIQPVKIEEKVAEAQAEVREIIKKQGEEATYETGILDLPPELVQLLGRLYFRTSYGQNALTHSIEVSLLAGALAEELGAKVEVAKKAGLLHDIGKAVDQEIEGTHLELGRKILMKYKMPEEVIKAMQAHHGDYPVETVEAAIINAADAISASRPGARKESLEAYLKRLGSLEEIATSFEGVEKAYAVSAGREIRVFVFPEKIDDAGAMQLARNIADQIEEKLKYPGEIKVTVVRETRAIEIAR
ncbi:MAG: ribonucrease [Patescibacteria group bacterium]|nr:ribonucrease [Patescibacteria group bacterium]